MNEQNFKTEYQLSENSVPVNTELKKKLIEMAKEYEKSAFVTPKTVISHTAKKKRIYKIAAELSAIAACAAICAYAIPKINSQYFDRLNKNEHISSTEIPEVEADVVKPQTADDKVEAAKSKNEEPEDKNDAADIKPDAAEGKNEEANNNSRNTRTVNRSAAVVGTVQNPVESVKTGEPKREEPLVDTPNANDAETQQDASQPREYRPEPANGARIIYLPSGEGFEYSKSELDTRINAIETNSRKLERWNDTLAPYRSDDETISGYYDSFSKSAAKYTAAAEDFELSYGNVNDSGQIYEGIEKYDAELDGILFEACRADYRKAKNYIEINLTDYVANEAEETAETESATETIEQRDPDVSDETAEPDGTTNSIGTEDSTEKETEVSE